MSTTNCEIEKDLFLNPSLFPGCRGVSDAGAGDVWGVLHRDHLLDVRLLPRQLHHHPPAVQVVEVREGRARL